MQAFVSGEAGGGGDRGGGGGHPTPPPPKKMLPNAPSSKIRSKQKCLYSICKKSRYITKGPP